MPGNSRYFSNNLNSVGQERDTGAGIGFLPIGENPILSIDAPADLAAFQFFHIRISQPGKAAEKKNILHMVQPVGQKLFSGDYFVNPPPSVPPAQLPALVILNPKKGSLGNQPLRIQLLVIFFKLPMYFIVVL